MFKANDDRLVNTGFVDGLKRYFSDELMKSLPKRPHINVNNDRLQDSDEKNENETNKLSLKAGQLLMENQQANKVPK